MEATFPQGHLNIEDESVATKPPALSPGSQTLPWESSRKLIRVCGDIVVLRLESHLTEGGPRNLLGWLSLTAEAY